MLNVDVADLVSLAFAPFWPDIALNDAFIAIICIVGYLVLFDIEPDVYVVDLDCPPEH